MKTISTKKGVLPIVVFFTLFLAYGQAQTILVQESFETDGEGIRYSSNTFDDNPTCDFFIRTNTQPDCHADPVTGVDGSYYWASEDVKNTFNGRPFAFLELTPFSVNGYSILSVNILLGVSNNSLGDRFETTDAIFIQYNMDEGGVEYNRKFLWRPAVWWSYETGCRSEWYCRSRGYNSFQHITKL